MKRSLKALAGVMFLLATSSGVIVPMSAVAEGPTDRAQSGLDSVNPEGAGGGVDLTTRIQQILQTIFLVIGIIAVIMIILGGINYTMSQGDPGKVKKAKDTILYGIIGLVVTLSAFAIVTFVMNALK